MNKLKSSSAVLCPVFIMSAFLIFLIIGCSKSGTPEIREAGTLDTRYCEKVISDLNKILGEKLVPGKPIYQYQLPENFQPASIFKVLKHISPAEGMILDMVKSKHLTFIYLRKADDKPFTDYRQVRFSRPYSRLTNLEKMLKDFRFDGTPESYFEAALFSHYFHWFDSGSVSILGRVMTSVEEVKSGIKTIQKDSHASRESTSQEQVRTALSAFRPPKVVFTNEDTAEVVFFTLEQWGDLIKHTFSISRKTPHLVRHKFNDVSSLKKFGFKDEESKHGDVETKPSPLPDIPELIPKSTGFPKDYDPSAVVESIRKAHNEADSHYRDGEDDSDPVISGPEFVAEAYFKILKHLSPPEGKALDYVIKWNENFASPFFYFRDTGVPSFKTFEDLQRAEGVNPDWDYMTWGLHQSDQFAPDMRARKEMNQKAVNLVIFLRMDDTPQSYYELLVFDLLHGLFYGNKRHNGLENRLVVSQADLKAFARDLDEYSFVKHRENLVKVLSMDLRPHVKMTSKNTAEVSVVIVSDYLPSYKRVEYKVINGTPNTIMLLDEHDLVAKEKP